MRPAGLLWYWTGEMQVACAVVAEPVRYGCDCEWWQGCVRKMRGGFALPAIHKRVDHVEINEIVTIWSMMVAFIFVMSGITEDVPQPRWLAHPISRDSCID